LHLPEGGGGGGREKGTSGLAFIRSKKRRCVTKNPLLTIYGKKKTAFESFTKGRRRESASTPFQGVQTRERGE